jgi:hypothetical protein
VVQELAGHQAGRPLPKEVAVRAGHTSTSFVLDRYGHLFPESDAALRDRLDELFVPVTEQRRNNDGARLPRDAIRAPEPGGPMRPELVRRWGGGEGI